MVRAPAAAVRVVGGEIIFLRRQLALVIEHDSRRLIHF